ncbi:MAG: hypothetical protein J6Y21_00025 [Clostridia bacterium]|nr:hypothetical protein [Clostridia bacterium]
MKRFEKVVKTVLTLMLTGCVAGAAGCGGTREPGDQLPGATGQPPEATSCPEFVPEIVPEITNTEDSLRLRSKTLKIFERNETPVLEGFYNLYNPEVERCDDPEYPYRMWIFGESTGSAKDPNTGYDSIFHGRSSDLQHWEMWCGEEGGGSIWDAGGDPALWKPVMKRSNKSYDSIHNGDPSVVYKDGRYYMAFSSVGFDERDGVTYIVNCVMGAESTDGIHWVKSEAPLLIWDREYTEGWVAGTPTPPSTGGYHRPSLLWDNEESKWKLWFDYYLPGTFLSMGYAVNNSGFLDPANWQLIHAEETPQLRDWPNPEVVKLGGRYYAFTDAPGFGISRGGAQNDRQLVMAVSDNGWDWRVLGRILPEDKQFGSHLPQTFVLTDGSGVQWLYLFYSVTDKESLPRYIKANYMKATAEEIVKLLEN